MKIIARISFVLIVAGWLAISPDFMTRHASIWSWFCASGFTWCSILIALFVGFGLGHAASHERAK